MRSILVTDSQQRKTLAVVRSLGRRGVKILAAEETRWATSSFSRFCSQKLVNPNLNKKPEDYLHWLYDTLANYHCDVFFPMDDGSMEVAIKYRTQLETFCRLLIPETESYHKASDKVKSVQVALEIGLDCPSTVAPKSLDEIEGLSLGLSFPVIIKPRKSSGSRGMAVVKEKKELIATYIKVHQKYPFPLIQEYLGRGDKYDVCLLFDRKSELKASFVQKEIRCFPLEKGPSTVQESVWRPDLIEKAVCLMQKLSWQGIAEVEFMEDPNDGRAIFMEINPRFWGSLHTAILAGVDFPWLYYRLAIDEEVKQVIRYKVGVKCRWLLPGDILHFIFNKNRFSMIPSFFSTKNSGLNDDILSLEDPFPVLGFFLACIRYSFDRVMWKNMFCR